MTPMPITQFEHLYDHMNLSNLHLYGNFLEIYNLQVEAPLATVGRLFQELEILDRSLFTTYVTFVLGKAGYDIELLSTMEEDPQFTSKYSPNEWKEFCDFYQLNITEYLGAGLIGSWTEDFAKQDSKLRVMFLEILGTDDPNEIMSGISAGSRNLVVVHPRPVRQLKEEFLKIKSGLKERAPSAEVISTGELLPLFIQDERRRKIIEDEWEYILNEILSALIKSWPIIAVQQQRKVFDESKNLIRSSRAKYEMGQVTDSVRDAGIACEGILRIMCEIYEPNKLEKPPLFSDLLQVLHTHIVNEFGADIVHDLEFIREWRNKTTHAGYDAPKSSEAFKVLTKAELFMNLFESELLLRGRRARSWSGTSELA